MNTKARKNYDTKKIFQLHFGVEISEMAEIEIESRLSELFSLLLSWEQAEQEVQSA